MSRWNLAWLLGIPAVVLLGLTLSYSAPARDRDHNYRLVRTIVDVLSEVDKRYVRELDEKQMEKLVEDMINGGLERLDPHSVYFNSDDLRAFDTTAKGNFGGIGVQIGVDPATGRLVVISPMVGTPAYDAGILAGDLILKIDDTTTEQLRSNEAVKLIQGEPGKEIRLTVLHEGSNEPVEVSMKRAIIEIQTVLGWQRDPADPTKWDYFADPANKIAYLRIVQFSDHTYRDIQQAMEIIQQRGARGLVLDLRDNPGGLLQSAVEIADLFLSNGVIVSTKNRHGQGPVLEAKEAGTMFLPAEQHPMAVLINKNSASASEVLAAALQDHKRAVVVGERSYGKGSVQQVFRNSSRDQPTALKLTTDTYWRPSGHNIHRHPDSKESDEWGVLPEKDLTITLKDEERFRFLEWRRSRDVIRGKGPMPMAPQAPQTPEKPTEEKAQTKKPDSKPEFTDRVLDAALGALRKKLGQVGVAPFQNLQIPLAG
ncbi:S41 family peptidase [Tuwongella immobilis]|uniref:PDZ domain-containing protein n=1 Tax=Tuwongella immobilis TaxID=692036 RepID=A0A6C2YS24_9BACT|nr:S41 family peptidase [Tuwongella immobilis]VIP04468.1 carboxyl-terminal protease : C-terminal processing peptidase OS=Singulisphaera acidiphila (strain ATCC BAA-1392 / DSM 18658 / VKM B-2454 / MOB10) GN=Sinac_5296 PE=3 SV=1: PDZ_2: Peptidase_S41 [Tuwongella immobilis]VTS06298.1 carboxyl-terminal protease : C-terminal processing peptidase OS=Singulisphaera acidiphila (strain ATCC BAA-1392 / DSM 18658 / VKM B-2454 / MOB10) GN=Sinac_5296 PE=3 SV=1: PDZ_2: Peptidase_S41 [Tuwongella immobilis]